MFLKVVLILNIFLLITGCGGSGSGADSDESAAGVVKVLEPKDENNQWIGNGIAYSPYRDGESPDLGSLTSEADILEDLQLIAQNWQLIRLYGAGAVSERILKIIDDNDLPIKVQQGAWISSDLTANQIEVNSAINLANTYPDIIVSVNIGNEMLVSWSDHRLSDVSKVVDYIRQTKGSIQQPVTVNEVYEYWNQSGAIIIANEVDYISVHLYAFWDSRTISQSLSYTQGLYNTLQSRYPSKQIVIGEAGWPSDDEGTNIRPGEASINNLDTFFTDYSAWINQQQIVSFYFEAFDENWKGGTTLPVEKNWGIYFSDRQPKIALP